MGEYRNKKLIAAARLGKPLVAKLIKDGKMDEFTLYWMDMVDLSEKYGWLPDEIERQDPMILLRYKAILTGRELKTQHEAKKSESRRANISN